MIEKLYTIKASVDSKRVVAEGLVKPLPGGRGGSHPFI